MRTWPIRTSPIESEADIVGVRQCAHRIAELLGIPPQDRTRIATAVSEIARNAFSYAGGGRAEFLVQQSSSFQQLLIRISDRGPGIAELDAILEGRFRSEVGMGLGIVGARRLLHHFNITSGPGGTTVELGQRVPEQAARLTPETLDVLLKKLGAERPIDPLSALRQQNHELLESLEELRRRQAEADELTHELADTNRGVVALYAELDTRAEQLRQASETKSRFLSSVSHELRTPLNSMLALSGLLLDGIDGELNSEQRRQIGYMRKSAQELLELVNDLLDLAKVEAGKIDVKDVEFSVEELFGALRSTLKPLRQDAEVQLIFESAHGAPALYSDEGKISQILRNFISNALKFTERGEVHVSAHYDSRERRITFAVSDTGIGIEKEYEERIFEEFFQIQGRLQKKAKGTGLGLPLSRKLAELLGGEVWVESEPGRGSTFFLSLPARPAQRPDAAPGEHAPDRKRVLIIDDDETFRYVLRQILREQRYEVLESSDGEQGLRSLRNDRPDAVMLDLQMPTVDGFEVLRQLREDPDARRIPVIVSTSLHVDEALLSRLPAGVPVLPKADLSRDSVRHICWMRSSVEGSVLYRDILILNVDDDEPARYAKTRALQHAGFRVVEAEDGGDALRKIEELQPVVALMDVNLPDISGIEVCAQTKQRWPHIFVLQTSATFTTGADRTRGLDSGADAYLVQPIEPAELVAAVRALLRVRKAEEELRRVNETLELRVQERTADLAEANARLVAEMAQRKRAEAALVQAQKMEAIGQLTGGIAHDFNNLLTAIVGNVDRIRARATDPKIVRLAENAFMAAERGSKLTAQLLAFSRTQRLETQPVDVNALLSGMRDLANQSLGPSVNLRMVLGEDLPHALADPNQLELAILNLAINARDAISHSAGEITITTSRLQSSCRRGRSETGRVHQHRGAGQRRGHAA